MKGQYRIIKEVILFAIGVGIAVFVLFSFSKLEKDIEVVTMQNRMRVIASDIRNAIFKLYESGANSTIYLEIPEKLGDNVYVIKLIDDNITLFLYDNPKINVTEKIFNISQDNLISGEVASISKYIEITRSGSNIILRRYRI